MHLLIKRKKEKIDTKNFAIVCCDEAEKQLAEESNSYSEETEKKITETVKTLRTAINEDNHESIKELTEQLKSTLREINLGKNDTDTSVADDF
jgi:molecular chaperone DnaK (HSP70)